MSSTITLRNISDAPEGDMGQTYLASGEHVALRHWYEGPNTGKTQQQHTRDYETVGFVISGKAELKTGSETHVLEKGVSWCIPAGTPHSYVIHETFTAIEATSPPAREEGDAPAK